MKVIGVTLGWDGRPTTVMENGKVFSRYVEDICRSDYYPDGPGTWPCDPKTGERLPTHDYSAKTTPGLLVRFWRWLTA